jgi:hypothetical protein
MQNAKKRKKKADATSQFTGVYLDKNGHTWDYQLKANGKIVATGRYPTEIEAARARDRAALKYHGQFARLNFPREDYINEIKELEKNTEKPKKSQ